jgi:hypothetical protein
VPARGYGSSGHALAPEGFIARILSSETGELTRSAFANTTSTALRGVTLCFLFFSLTMGRGLKAFGPNEHQEQSLTP